jgi:hypothetical protein
MFRTAIYFVLIVGLAQAETSQEGSPSGQKLLSTPGQTVQKDPNCISKDQVEIELQLILF